MGWESVFYVQGAMTLVWCVLWFILVTDSPRQHKGISEAEKEYILASIGDQKKMKVRWLRFKLVPFSFSKFFTSCPRFHSTRKMKVWFCLVLAP